MYNFLRNFAGSNMVKKFTFWLEGLIEDDPLPAEITHILFNSRHNGNYKYIELLGYEKEINQNALAYYPLEAQLFFCNEIAKLNDNGFEYEVKYLIEECFSSRILKNQFKNKKIYFKYKEKINFLFKV